MSMNNSIKKRKDCFIGIHSDFHAIPEYGTIGATLKEEDIREICRLLKPDFWQIDSKGHPGWASYPSDLGNAMPNFAFDTLKLWRRVTREEGVALYLHYSALYDIKYGTEHPEECVVGVDGIPLIGTIRPSSRYVDELLIPQILELAGKYGVDGIWLDGECWKVHLDYHPDTIAAFEEEHKISFGGNPPISQNDSYYLEYCEFCREQFRRYVRHYTDVVHSFYPDFQICSNWAYTDHMPEPVSAKVDFISGDLNPVNSYNSARYAGRAIAQQNKPWDLMSWNFRYKVLGALHPSKHPIQIMQEAAAVISLGGAYQDDVMQFQDGSPNVAELRQLAPVFDFLHARKNFCFRGTPYHQVALFLSTNDRSLVKVGSGMLYARKKNENVFGLTALLCDAGQSLEIVSEHTLKNHYNDYPVIVVPETLHEIEESTLRDLLAYANSGGNLILVGKKTCRIFSELKVPFSTVECNEVSNGKGLFSFDTGHNKGTENIVENYAFTLDGQAFGGLVAPCRLISDNPDTVFATFGYHQRDTQFTLAACWNYGKGKIAAIGFDIGSQYQTARQYLHRDLIKMITDALYTPIVRVESATGLVEIICLNKDEKLMIQLINANGDHSNTSSVTENVLPPALDIKLSLRFAQVPKKLLLQPENKELIFEIRNGKIFFEIDRIDIHNVIEVVV